MRPRFARFRARKNRARKSRLIYSRERNNARAWLGLSVGYIGVASRNDARNLPRELQFLISFDYGKYLPAEVRDSRNDTRGVKMHSAILARFTPQLK